MSEKRVVIGIEPNQGYGAYQIEDPMTLDDLAKIVSDAITEYGGDTQIVTDNGQLYGPRFGSFSRYDSIEPAEFRPGDDDGE